MYTRALIRSSSGQQELPRPPTRACMRKGMILHQSAFDVASRTMICLARGASHRCSFLHSLHLSISVCLSVRLHFPPSSPLISILPFFSSPPSLPLISVFLSASSLHPLPLYLSFSLPPLLHILPLSLSFSHSPLLISFLSSSSPSASFRAGEGPPPLASFLGKRPNPARDG